MEKLGAVAPHTLTQRMGEWAGQNYAPSPVIPSFTSQANEEETTTRGQKPQEIWDTDYGRATLRMDLDNCNPPYTPPPLGGNR